ncbi:unnamed protein product [Dicrocoelium dendriticum]|nr:unnamed protein product [Dicrocoelium dendriticum]
MFHSPSVSVFAWSCCLQNIRFVPEGPTFHMVSEKEKNISTTQTMIGAAPAIQMPAPLNMDERSLASNWRLWKSKWMDFCTLSRLDKQPMAYRLAMFRHAAGDDARRVLETLCYDKSEDANNLETVLEKFSEYCEGQTNETFQRYLFFSRNRRPGESVDTYVTELKILARSCSFCKCMADSLIRDRIVLGINDEGLTKRLLRKRNLSLQQCIDICNSESSTAYQFQQMTIAGDSELCAVSRSKTTRATTARQEPCNFCATRHPRNREQCPAWGRICVKCGKRNHFARCCQSTDVSAFVPDKSKEDTEQSIGNVSRKASQKCVYASLLIEGRSVRFQLDTGATINILPRKHCRGVQIQSDQDYLRMWNGSRLKPKGSATIEVVNPRDGVSHRLQFVIVDEDLTPILGIDSILSLGFVIFNHDRFVYACQSEADVSDLYPSVFSPGLGEFEGTAHLSLDPLARPIALPARRVPFALRDRFSAELNKLVMQGVIAKVDEPTDWVSQVAIITKKNGELRVCIDPKPLNEALRREHYALPTLEDVLPRLTKAKFFTKVDLSSAFWHVVLDDESSFLTTFATPFGRYRWLRLPFGLKVSSEIFQKRLVQAIDDLDGVTCVADDVLIYGSTEEEHDTKLHRFLRRCVQKNIKLKREKVELRKEEVIFHGHVLTSDGIRVDPGKIKAIQEMPSPNDVKAVHRLNGMVNYLSRFLPGLADVMTPIRQLTHKGVNWSWGKEQDLAFETIKNLISNAPVLGYYDPAQPLEVQCDSSQSGIGAVLLQNGRPLDFRSRALTETEKRYAQIEKEMLAVVYAMERFNDYTFGRKTTVYTDHKPLVSIATKPLNNVPRRLQRMLIRLQKYDIDIVYTPGTQMFIADTLSRAHPPVAEHHLEEIETVNMVQHLAVTENRLKDIRRFTEEDQTFAALRDVILNGWPETKKQLPKELTPYFNFRDELTVCDGLLFKGSRILIPSSLRKEMLEHVHRAHLGANYTINRARELMFWPGMTGQIKDHVSNCEACRSHDIRQTKEPMMLHDVPDRPWQKVAVDLFWDNGKDYLLTVDYYSDYFEIDLLTTTTTEAVINKLRCQFARHGIPEELVSDNGPQFSSMAFQVFATKWEFAHRQTSPYHSQSNGKAESAVKQAKRLLAKARDTREDPYLMLLESRNTPSTDIGLSPVQRLYSRRTRTVMPASATLLRPVTPQFEKVQNNLKRRMATQKRYYDNGARELPELTVGEEVWVEPIPDGQERWRKGVVAAKVGERSYEVNVGGKKLRRNRVQLRRCPRRQHESGRERYTACGNEATSADPTKRTRSGKVYGLFSKVQQQEHEKGRM